MNVISENKKWLSQIDEEIIEPDQRIIDPHHHLWHKTSDTAKARRKRDNQYLLDDLWLDTSSGHNVTDTVFIECSECYWENTDKNFGPVGETEFVKGLIDLSRDDSDKASISGIVGHADLSLGDKVQEILEKHQEQGGKYFKGIRHAGGWDPHEEINNSHHNPPEGLYLQNNFQIGLEHLAKKGLLFEAWQYHHQINQITEIAKKHPELIIILNHFSGPIGIGPYLNKKDEIFDAWKTDLKKLSMCNNVFAKLGGLAMPVNGFNFHKRSKPPSSTEFVEEQKNYYMTAIEFFGPSRCMFESNFPVDKVSISYHVLWNGFKKMVVDFSQSEKDHLFFKTAETVYSI